MPNMRMRRHCTCGAAWACTAPRAMVEGVLRIWEEEHSGPGHAPCDAKTAARARARAERKQFERRISGETP